MKVILLKDVPKIGRKYEVKDVAEGHATNFLMPRGLAEVATSGALKKLDAIKRQDDEKRKVREDLLLKNIGDLNGATVQMTEKANEQGHLFAGIHKEELVPEIHKQTRLEILPEHIILDKPIKEVGEHEVEVKVQDTSAKFRLVVNAVE